MQVSSNVVDKIVEPSEAFKSVAYPDPGSKDGTPYTLGFGTTMIDGSPVKPGMTCTKDQAIAWMLNDLQHAASVVTKAVKVPLTQNQFDALTDFVYNVGEGQFLNSTLLKLLNAKDYIDAANQFDVWIYNNKKKMGGLVTRRALEKKLFLS